MNCTYVVDHSKSEHYQDPTDELSYTAALREGARTKLLTDFIVTK